MKRLGKRSKLLPMEQEVCDTLKDVQERSGLSQAALARAMTRITGETWGQSRVWKLLSANGPVHLYAVQAAAEALGIVFENPIRPRQGVTYIVNEREHALLLHLKRSGALGHLLALLEIEDVPVEEAAAPSQRRA